MPFLAVVLFLGGFLAYQEATRDFPPAETDRPHPPGISSVASGSREIQELQRQVDAEPENDRLLLRLANLQQDESAHDPGLLPRAIESYQTYLKRNPSSEDARVDLGICYFELSRADTVHANALLQRALAEMSGVYEINPRNQAAAFNLGIVSLNAGLMTDSMEWFRRAYAIDPETNLGRRAKELLEQHSFGGSTE